MIEHDDTVSKIRPIILAGGLGTRLRPRTKYLPKPLLPVNGRPLLWYTFNSLSGTSLLPPIVVLGYKGELIRAYFERENVKFWDLPEGTTMAEDALEVVENDNAEAFLGMSSDVIVPKKAVEEILKDYTKYKQDIALFVNLQTPGHKKWEFIVEDNHLKDIRKKDILTNFERVLLIMTRQSLLRIRTELPKPITEDNVPNNLKEFQTGWILILKTMILTGITVYSRIVDIPVCNINVPADFDVAEKFVRNHMEQ